MANESTKWLYRQLTDKGYNVGKDYAEFDNLMQTNADSRKWAYETAAKEGYNVGADFNEFEGLVAPSPRADSVTDGRDGFTPQAAPAESSLRSNTEQTGVGAMAGPTRADVVVPESRIAGPKKADMNNNAAPAVPIEEYAAHRLAPSGNDIIRYNILRTPEEERVRNEEIAKRAANNFANGQTIDTDPMGQKLALRQQNINQANAVARAMDAPARRSLDMADRLSRGDEALEYDRWEKATQQQQRDRLKEEEQALEAAWEERIKTIDQDIAQVKEAIKGRQAVVDKERGPKALVADMGGTAHWDEELMNLNRRLDILEETKHRYERGKDSKDKSWLWNTWYGIADGSVELVKNPLGLKGASDSMVLYRVNEKAKRGDLLTESERGLLDAYGLKQQTEQYAQPLGAAYQIGGGVPAVVEMAAEFGLAPGAGMARSAWSAAANASMKQFDKALVRAMGKSIAEGMSISSTTQLGKNINNALDRTMSAPVYDSNGELAGFEGESLTEALLKTGFQSTASNAVFLVHSPLAKSVYGNSIIKSGSKAAGKGATFAERHPKVNEAFDRVGRWIEGFNGGKSKVIPFNNPIDGFVKMKASEVAPILMGDGEWEDWLDPKQNAMLIGQLLTMEFTSGAYGSARAGINRMTSKSRMRKAYQTAREAFRDSENPDEAVGMHMSRMLESSDSRLVQSLGAYRAEAQKTLRDKATKAATSLDMNAGHPDNGVAAEPLSVEQADALIDLARATYSYLGVRSPRMGNDDVYRKSMDFYNRTNGKVWKDVRGDMNRLLRTTEYEALEKIYVDAASEQIVDAHGNPVPLERRRREAAMEYRYAVEEASREFGLSNGQNVDETTSSVLDFINEHAGEWRDYDELLYRINTSDDMSRGQKEAAKAFLFAERKMAGSKQLLVDQMAEARREQARHIDERTHTDGYVREVTLRDGRKVFVKSGTLATREATDADGNMVREVDFDKSHNTIVVREPETGKTEMIDPHDIAEVAAPVEAKAMLKEIADETEKAVNDEYTAQMNGAVELSAGSEYELLMEDNSFEKARIVDIALSQHPDTEQTEVAPKETPAERMVVLEFSDGSRQTIPENEVLANIRQAEYERYRRARRGEDSADRQPASAEIPEPGESANTVDGAVDGNAATPEPKPAPVKAKATEVAAGDIISIGGKEAHVAEVHDGIVTVWTTDRLNENSYTDQDTPGYYTSLNRSELDSMADRDADGAIVGIRADRDVVDSIENNSQSIAPENKIENGHIKPQNATVKKSSDETDSNGLQFIIASSGTTEFGRIREGDGLQPLPIKLSEGFNKKDDRNNNIGYGLEHIEAGHGDEIRAAGFADVTEFVEYVSANYQHIYHGVTRKNGAETYILEAADSKSNVLYIELSKNGEHWTVNSGGIFRKGYTRNKKPVEPLPAFEAPPSRSGRTVQEQNDLPLSGNSVSTESSDGKVTNSASDKQEIGAESSPRAIDRLPRDQQGDPVWDAPGVDAPTTWAALNEVTGSKDRASNMLVKQQQYIAGEIDKLSKKEPRYKEPAAKGDINAMLRAENAARDKYRREHDAWEADMSELQRRAAHWRSVAEAEREIERQEQARQQAEADELRRRSQESERREAEQREAERERSRIEHERQAEEDRKYFEDNRERIEAEQRRAEEAEQRRQAERENLTEDERLAWEAEKRSFDKKLREVAEEVRDSEAALDILRDTTPQSIDEVAAMLLSSNKVIWKSEFGTNGTRVITGADAYSGLGESERRKLMGMWAGRDKGGISIDSLAEDKFKELCQEYGIPYDNAEARDALIDMIRTSATRGSITNYIAERRMEQARRQAELERQYEEAQIEQAEREDGATQRTRTEQPEGIDNESVQQLGRTLPDEELPFHRGGDAGTDREVYEAGKGLVEASGIPVVEVGNAEARAVLENHNNDTQLMGSRTDRKMARVAEHYAGRELDANTQAVVDVFSGKHDNVAIEVERPEGKRRVVMRQGKEPKAGAKHSLFRHFETRSNYVTADDIALIPDIIAKGERSVNANKVMYSFVTEDGTRARVTTELRDNVETFTNLYTNRKTSVVESSSVANNAVVTRHHSGAQSLNPEVRAAKVGNNSHTGKENDRKLLRTPSGEVYGWTAGGKVYLNRDAMNPETPVHEYTHLWDRMVRQQNPKLWERGKELLKQTELWHEVENDPNYADIRGDEDAIASEVHSRLTGRDGARLLREMLDRAAQQGYVAQAQATDLLGKIRRWMSDMFSALKGTLEKWSGKELQALTLEDFNNMTLRDLAEGGDPRKEGGSNGPVQLSAAMARRREDFEAMREQAIAERGIVMPGLNEAEVRIVDVPRHDFEGDKPIAAACKWAKENIVGEHTLIDSNGNEVPYTISGKSIDKYLSASAIGKSVNLGVHLSVLKQLPEVIGESIEAEVHADYLKGSDGKRNPENGYNSNKLIHRFYGMVEIDSENYRVKTTIEESRTPGEKIKSHSFEVTNIELLPEDNSPMKVEPTASGYQGQLPHGTTKLLKGVEKSYDSGVKLLERSKKSTSFYHPTDPTEAQKKAGNYKMEHRRIDGLKVSIENSKGSMRRGTDASGAAWETRMNNDYGYIRGTTGVDGDKIDVFLSDNPAEGDVYVVDQYNKDGSFDEHKVMYGFKSAEEAKAAYLSNYSADWAKDRNIVVTGVSRGEFRKWLDASDRKTKPFADYKNVKSFGGQSNTQMDHAPNTDVKNPDKPGFIEAVKTLYEKGKDAAAKLFQMKFFDVARTPGFMKNLGLKGEKFTIRYGVIARHFGKDGSHNLSEVEWSKLPEALQRPFAISKLEDKKDSYRLYTTLQNAKGEYVVVGVDVKNAGRDLEVNAIATVFGRRNDAGLTMHERIIYTDKNITPNQQSLLNGPNSRQYPADRELSGNKVNTLSPDKQGNGENNSENIVREPAVGRRSRKVAGVSLFDRRADEGVQGSLFDEVSADAKPGRSLVERAIDVANAREADKANGVIEGYAERYMEYADAMERRDQRMAELEQEIERRQAAGEDTLEAEMELDALRDEAALEDSSMDEHRAEAVAQLGAFYRRLGNTPEDADRMAIDRAKQTRAEVEIRRAQLASRRRLEADEPSLRPETEPAPPTEGRDNDTEGAPVNAIVETAGGDRIGVMSMGGLPKLKEGDFALVERRFIADGMFTFDGKQRIESVDDVAYIFRKLEDFAQEHSFVVMQQADGSFKVVHTGMGNAVSTIVDMSAVRAAYEAFGAQKIWFVHNHPSGTLRFSDADVRLIKKMKEAFIGEVDDVEAIIIDTRSGKYVAYSGDTVGSTRQSRSEGEIGVEFFGGKKFADDYNTDGLTPISSAASIAGYVAELRLGNGVKSGYLVLDRGNKVMANIVINGEPEAGELAREMTGAAIRYGGTRVVRYSNGNISGSRLSGSELMELKNLVQRISMDEVSLLDNVDMRGGLHDGGNYFSAFDNGLLHDSEAAYGSEAERAEKIRQLKPIEVQTNNMSRDELRDAFGNLQSVNKNGTDIRYLRTTFGKNYKEGGLFAQVVPQLDSILRDSVLAYSEADNLGGTHRPDGTIHKSHPNVISFDNYVGKVVINGKEYYVRQTVQNTRDNSTGVHSCFVSDVALYENTAQAGTDSTILRRPNLSQGGIVNTDVQTTSTENPRVRPNNTGIVDAKLQQFFERASSRGSKSSENFVNGSEATYGSEAEQEMIENQNKTFNSELKRWTSGTMQSSEHFNIGRPIGVLSNFMPDVPLILRQAVLTKARKKHSLTAAELENLPGAIARPIFVFQSKNDSIGVLTEIKANNGKNIFAAIEIGIDKQLGHRVLTVNNILSIHDRDIENIVMPIVENNSLRYVDKIKGLDWLSSAKTNSQAIANETFDSAAKIVKDFDNQTFAVRKNSENFMHDSEAAYGSEVRRNIRAGIDAMKRIANGEEEVENAMVRPDLENYGGTEGITFVFGKTGNADKGYKGGYGLSHIGAKHGPESLRQVLDVIANGHIERYIDGNKTVVLSNGEYEAVLALTRNGQRQSWLLTGWDKITTDENGKVSASTVSTQANPTFSREDLGAVVNDAKLQQFFERASSRGSKSSENFVNDPGAPAVGGDEARPMSAKERVMAYMLELDQKAHEHGEVRNAGMAALSKMSRRVEKAMRLQQQYDATLLADVTSIARSMMNAGLIDSRSRLELSRTMAAMRSAVSDKDVKECARRLMDVAASSQLRILSDRFEKLVNIKARKKDAHGVSVAGSLDFAGQEMLEAFNEGRGMSSVEPLEDRIKELENKLDKADNNANEIRQARRLGFELALRYKELVSKTVDNELELKAQLEYHKGTWKDCTNEAERRDYREKKASLEENLRDEQFKAADALRELTDIMFDRTSEARERLMEFRKSRDERRLAIYHNVNSDLEGRALRLNSRKLTGFDHVLNSPIGSKFLLKPLGTFEQMMREFGRNSINGEGYLFDRFVRGWQECRDKQFKQQQEIEASLDEQVRTILGGKTTRWSDIYKLSNKKAGTLTWSEGKYMEEHDVTEGQLVYIYMVNKMPDGRMKLRHMGIDEAKVKEIEQHLNPKLKALADWMQQVKLPELREVFNDTHIKVFGSAMAEIEDYFPIRILPGSRLRNVVIDENGGEPATPSTIVGAIRNRTKNACSLDILNSDAFSVMLDHVRTMTEWNNFAQYNQDLGTLLSYNGFTNKVRNMRTVYGSGDQFLKTFKEHTKLVGGVYKPKTGDFNKGAMNLLKLGTGACISFRISTAIKQLLSAPAFNSEARADDMAYCTLNSAGSVKWCMQNLPAFERRWKDRLAGNEILRDSDADWDWTNKNWFKTLQRTGITPNAAVDAYTCAIGARAVYRTKLRNYLKEGFDQATAHSKACSDAEIAFNLSQQSGENMYLSTIQNDRNFLTSVFTVFRNSPMSYARQTYQSARELYNSLQPGGKERQLAFETKKLMRDGLTEDQARYAARKRYYRNLTRNTFKFLDYAALLPSLWAWGLSGMWYSIFGDDPKKKLQHAKDALLRGCTFGWAEGFAGGGTLPDVFFKGLMDGEWKLSMETVPAATMFEDCFHLADIGKTEQLIQQAVNTVVSVGVGVNPQVLEDVALAGIDFFTNEKDWRDYAILAMRIMQAPQSQIDQVYLDRIGMSAAEAKSASPAELAERYALYKMSRQNLAGLLITDAQRRGEMGEKYKERFEDIVKDLHLQNSEPEVLEALERARKHSDEYNAKSKRARRQSYVAMAEVEREKARDFGQRIWSEYNGGLNVISKEWLLALDGATAAKAAEDLTRYRALLAKALECGSVREARAYAAEMNALRGKYKAMEHKRMSRR